VAVPRRRAPPRRKPDDTTPTKRELEVLQQLAMGRGARQIGKDLGISPRTVQNHYMRLSRKWDVRTRAAAVAFGFRRGYLS
jgi:DNA-binding NarL/FixJ family response regulator